MLYEHQFNTKKIYIVIPTKIAIVQKRCLRDVVINII